MRKFILLICLFMASFTSFADDERTYSLRQVTAEEYISALPNIWYYYRVIPFAFDGIVNYAAFENLIEAEIDFRYPNFLPSDAYLTFEAYRLAYHDDFEELFSWYTFWLQAPVYFADGHAPRRHQDYKRWNEELMLIWLNQNQIDLDAINGQGLEYLRYENSEPISEFPEQHYTVIAVDFDLDGQNEWLLRNDAGYYIVVAKRDGIYQKVQTPLWWFDYYLAFGYEEFSYETIDIRDINADGVNEWLVLKSSLVRGEGRSKEVIILTWRNQLLETVFSTERIPDLFNDFSFSNVITFQNSDEDDALEILYYEDLFDWNGESYVATDFIPSPSPSAYPSPAYTATPSPSNLFYQGISAFQAQDYATALWYFDNVPREGEGACSGFDEPLSIEALYDDLCFHYWRALSLEALGREQEALDEYIYVLNRSLSRVDFDAETIGVESILPEYMWYQLVSLHLTIEPAIELPPLTQG
jgi:hypothetical protein